MRGKRKRGKRKDALGSIPNRAEYIELGLKMEIPQEHLEREYDKWAATEEGQKYARDTR